MKRENLKLENLITLFALCLCALVVCLPSAQAQLTATVTPGYQFAEGDRPTVDALNQLGQPTVEISGTIGGSVGLSAASVTGTHLADSVVDDVTIAYTNTSPRAIKVKDFGVSTNQISTNIAGVGLGGGGGAPLLVNIDSNTISISSDALFLTETVVTNIGLSSSTRMVTNAHSLARLPRWIRGTLVCTNADLAYSVGDEVDLQLVCFTNSFLVTQFSADATSVFLAVGGSGGPSASNSWRVRRKDTGALDGIATNKWLIKIYARP